MDFETIGQYHDRWASVLIRAPNRFRSINGEPVDQAKRLIEEFDDLKAGFHFAERKMKDERLARIAREMLEMSFEAYRAGDGMRGAHILLECEGMIWTGSRQPVKYAVEAERRAFGIVERFQGISVSPYPMEQSISELGDGQKKLLETAEAYCRGQFSAKKDFEDIAWVLMNDGTIAPIIERSRKRTEERLEEHVQSGTISAAVIAELVIGGVSGMIIFHLHQRGLPRVEAIARITNWEYEPLRFHFHEPTIFAVQPSGTP